MRSVLSIFVFFAGALPAFAQEPPRAPVPAPAPKAQDYPAFDGGTRVEFYAEQNVYRAYLANPADFTLFEETFVAGDFGGDLSFGGFSYSRNRGTAEPGPTEPEDKAGLDVSYTAGLGGRAFGAYRRDFLVAGGSFDFNRGAASFGYNGEAITVDPFFAADEGYNDVDLVSQKYGITAVAAAALEPHAVGLSFSLTPERIEGDYDFEYLPLTSEEGIHRVERLWGRREVKDYCIKGGYSLRPGEAFDVGGAFGLRILRSNLDWRDESAEEVPTVITKEGETGTLKMKGLAVTLGGNGRYKLLENLRVGGALAMEFIPGITMDWRGETWDLSGPFGERETEDYRLAKGSERHYGFGGGLAFYPDEKTTLAFDYGYDRFSASGEVYDEGRSVVEELEFSCYHTFTRLGVERWIIDDLAARVGWEQDLFSYPRNVFFGGLAYKFDDDWFINYDYRGGQLTVNNLSLFVPFDDVVKPASHRFTVVRYF